MARTILITGAAGSIGKKLRAHFEAKGGYDSGCSIATTVVTLPSG